MNAGDMYLATRGQNVQNWGNAEAAWTRNSLKAFFAEAANGNGGIWPGLYGQPTYFSDDFGGYLSAMVQAEKYHDLHDSWRYTQVGSLAGFHVALANAIDMEQTEFKDWSDENC